jgi:hypothetical protein
MTTFYSEPASASWQGNYFPRSSFANGPTWQNFSISVTAAQAVSGNIFNLVKLDRNTIVLDGTMTATGLDVNSSTTAVVDLGYLSDANGDGDTNNADWFVDGAALPTLTGSITASFFATAADGFEVSPFIPAFTLTSTGKKTTGYFISASLLGTVATAGVGVITVGLLLADRSFVTAAGAVAAS